jgi:cysteine desulfurase/selenocysteine lyase
MTMFQQVNKRENAKLGSQGPQLDVARIRADFPMLRRSIDGERLVYLDSAATTLKPQSVVDAVVDYYTRFTANIHRGRHRLSEEASDRYEEARCRAAQLMGCASNEVVFVRNATEGLNLAAELLGLTKRDLVVGFLDAHHSQLLPWQARATLKLVQQAASWLPDLDHYRSLLADRPRAVVVSHCSNVTGGYLPLELIARLAREAGAAVVVDAAQSAAHERLNFAELDVEFLAFSSHKMLGPSGIGCLLGKAETLRNAKPLLLGGGMVDYVTAEAFQLRKIPHKFEAGTPAIEAACGFAAAVDYLEMHGFDAIQAYERALTEHFLEELKTRQRLRLLGTDRAERRAPIFSLYVDGLDDLSDVSRALSDSYGVMCRNGHLCAQPLVDAYTGGEVIRLSAYLYNTPQELSFALDALDGLVRAYRC